MKKNQRKKRARQVQELLLVRLQVQETKVLSIWFEGGWEKEKKIVVDWVHVPCWLLLGGCRSGFAGVQVPRWWLFKEAVKLGLVTLNKRKEEERIFLPL